MQNEEIYAYLLQLLKEVTEDETLDESLIRPETDVFEDLGLNSISALYIAMTIEDHFGIRIPNEKTAELHTVGSFVDYIASNRN